MTHEEPKPELARPRATIPAATGNPIRPPDHSLLRAAWLAVALGLAVEGLVLLSAALSGGSLAAKPFTAELVQKIAWSFVVCVALAVARTASRAAGAVMGISGLLAAPLAFAVARGLHKGAAQALGLVAAAVPGPSPLLIAAIKGLEYALLGVLIGWMGKKAWGSVGAHALAGGGVALLFGTPLVILSVAALPQVSAAAVLARAVNELAFPVGCALVLYASDTLGKRLA